ncbi:hypothetical protein HAX54_020190 [Datura stramonium]|uniref:Uncharacterized protein n=1 Tax=Datura stramonium TaxID=4076 RepID=A0ABS8URD1_DATST|nr:hypothetical protein [Datura stramonium]
MGLANLLTRPEIGENNNVSGGARATNVGDINTDYEVEKDLGETENLEDINLEVGEEFGEVSEKVDVDVDIVDETEQYVEGHLDGVETDVESSPDLEEEAGIDRGFEDIERNKVARYTGRLGGDEDYIDSSEEDSDDSKDELNHEVVAGVVLPGRRKSTKLRYDNECGVSTFELGMIFESGTSSERVVIARSNIINTAPTNNIGFKPPGLRWMGREAIGTSQLQQMRNSRSGNL